MSATSQAEKELRDQWAQNCPESEILWFKSFGESGDNPCLGPTAKALRGLCAVQPFKLGFEEILTEVTQAARDAARAEIAMKIAEKGLVLTE